MSKIPACPECGERRIVIDVSTRVFSAFDEDGKPAGVMMLPSPGWAHVARCWDIAKCFAIRGRAYLDPSGNMINFKPIEQ